MSCLRTPDAVPPSPHHKALLPQGPVLLPSLAPPTNVCLTDPVSRLNLCTPGCPQSLRTQQSQVPTQRPALAQLKPSTAPAWPTAGTELCEGFGQQLPPCGLRGAGLPLTCTATQAAFLKLNIDHHLNLCWDALPPWDKVHDLKLADEALSQQGRHMPLNILSPHSSSVQEGP